MIISDLLSVQFLKLKMDNIILMFDLISIKLKQLLKFIFLHFLND